MESLSEKAQLLIAFLYTQARVMHRDALEKLLNVTTEDFEKITAIATETLQGTGLAMMVSPKDVALVTDPKLGKELSLIMDEEAGGVLTPVQAETLSLIAYGGKMTRIELDYLRGVSSRFIVRLLLMRGLIDEEKEGGQTYLVPTGEFLRSIGIAQVAELPDYDTLHSEIRETLEGMEKS